MKVLMCNSYYYLRGGIERCFLDLSALLQAHGHEVIPFCMHHPRNHPSEYSRYFVSEIDFPKALAQKSNLGTKFRVVERVIYSREARQQIEELIKVVKPDIAHVHEIADEISPSILPALRQAGIPIVQTLHDYKFLCPNTNFVSHGKVCERCKKLRYYQVVLQRCKRDSASASLLACMEAYLHRLSRIYSRSVSVFIAPSLFLKNKLAEYGFNANIVHLPNFVDVNSFRPCYDPSDYFIYFGRLDQIKGILTVLEAMKSVKTKAKLYIVGEGELEGTLKEYASQHNLSNVFFLGYLSTDKLIPLIQQAAFSVVPSECYENYPMTILESFACGTPVIGSNIGAIPELIKDGDTGLLFEPGNAQHLAERIQYLLDHSDRAVAMGQNGRKRVETVNDRETYYERILHIYQNLLDASD